MKTIRFNTATNQFTIHKNQYMTYDGKPGRIDPPWVQLAVVETEKPAVSATQELLPVEYVIEINEGEHNLYDINGTATEAWSVRNRTEYETAMRDWAYPEYQKRIVAPDALLLDDVGSKVFNWFTGKGLPFENHGDNIRLYFNEVLPQHQALLNQFETVITIEDRPVE